MSSIEETVTPTEGTTTSTLTASPVITTTTTTQVNTDETPVVVHVAASPFANLASSFTAPTSVASDTKDAEGEGEDNEVYSL